MATDDSDRVSELEARLAALESRLRELERRSPADVASDRGSDPAAPFQATFGVEAASAEAAPVGQGAAPPPLPRPSVSKPDLEQFLGLKVLGRLGVTAVVIAALYFSKLGWDQIGPTGRVICIYLGAALMLGAGLMLGARGRVRGAYVGVLCGGAVALSYVAAVVAKLGYDLISGTTAFVLLVGSTALGQWLGRALRLEVIATVALGGGYLAPVLVGDPSATPTALLVYLLVLHTWAAWTEHRWSWHWARGGAVFGTVSILAAWFVANAMPSAWSLVIHVQVALLGVVAPELLALWHRRIGAGRWRGVISGLWLVHVLLSSVALSHPEVGIYGLLAGIGWLALALPVARRDDKNHGPDLARLAGVLLVLGACLCWNVSATDYSNLLELCDRPWIRVGALLGISAVLFVLRQHVRAGDLAVAVAAVVGLGITLSVADDDERRLLALLTLALPVALLGLGAASSARGAGLIVGGMLTFLAPGFVHHFGEAAGPWRAAAFAMTGLWIVVGAFVSSRRDDPALRSGAAVLCCLLGIAWVETAVWTHAFGGGLEVLFNSRLAAAAAVLMSAVGVHYWRASRHEVRDLVILAITALVVSYMAGVQEVVEFVSDWETGWRGAVVSLYSMAFAAGLLLVGFARDVAMVRRVGLAGLLLVAAKVALLDLAALDTSLRVLVTGVLGVVLIVGAWGYARVQRAT